jgi:heat shock protein HslJ
MKERLIYVAIILALVLSACTAQNISPAQSTQAPATSTIAPTMKPAEPTSAPKPTSTVAAAATTPAAKPTEPSPAAVKGVDPKNLVGTAWQWVAFTGPTQKITVDSPLNYTISFEQGGQIKIKADCNNASGDYVLKDNSLKITVGPMTRAACAPGSLIDTFLKYLGSTALFMVKDGSLWVDLFADGGTMQFKPLDSGSSSFASPSLTGTTWEWVAFVDPTQKTNIDTPQNFTLIFKGDGQLQIKADCNLANGNYTVKDQSLSITVGPTTLALCPSGNLGEKFVKYLGFSAIFFFKDGNLFIDLKADGGTLQLRPLTRGSESSSVKKIIGTSWQWVGFVDPNQKISITPPENYTISFQDNGQLKIKADCNNAGGSYTLKDKTLSISVGATTLAACPPGSLSDRFLKYLGSAAIYFFEDASLFIDLKADGGTLQFHLVSSSAMTPVAMGLKLEATPYTGTLFLGGGEEKWLNPTLVSILGGSTEEHGLDSLPLGPGCSGFIPTRPDVVVDWEKQPDVKSLRFFLLTLGDPSMVMVTPSGKVICSDDLNPLVLDPYIEIKDPEPGRYTLFLGTYEGDAAYPGFLVVTTHNLNPATLDIAHMFPRHIDPRGIPQAIPVSVLDVQSPEAAKPRTGRITPGELPYKQDLTGGGEIGAFNIELDNHLCTGFISREPTFRFSWTEDVKPLVLFFESNVDTTLIVRTPDGSYHCDDDFHGSQNINPWLTVASETGDYNIWVGSFSPDVHASGKLTITHDEKSKPAVLTSKDLK